MSFTSLRDLIALADERQEPIYRIMIDNEMELRSGTEEDLMKQMADQLKVMFLSVNQGTTELTMTRTGIAGGDGFRLSEYIKKGQTIVAADSLQVVANAMAVNEVNASMGKIVATPTAGSAGILPAVLSHVNQTGQFTQQELINVMFTASAIGLVIANRASISGAQGGCQAEIGSATAMAAAAIVELYGGSPEQAGSAVGLALKNSLGLVCDPVAGLVEIPCITRNGFHALTALAAADMALAGVKSVIPSDEVIDAMDSIGNELPASLRETGIGGLAGTVTGQEIRNRIFGSADLPQAEEKEVNADYKSAYEIIGPVMVGPSSSHTAGAVRLGNVARQILGEEPEEVVFTLMDSFAKTYQGHGTDVALLAGVMGFTTRDDEIKDAQKIAKDRGLKYNYLERNLGNFHPNTVRIDIFGANNKKVRLIGSSIGGGKILVQVLDSFSVKISGELPTLVVRHKDKAGVILQLMNFLSQRDYNVAAMSNDRTKIKEDALTIIEVDQKIEMELIDELLEHYDFIEDISLVSVK